MNELWAGVITAVGIALAGMLYKGLDAWGKYLQARALAKKVEWETQAQISRQNDINHFNHEQQEEQQVVDGLKGLIADQRQQLIEQRQLLVAQQKDNVDLWKAIARCEADRAALGKDVQLLQYRIRRLESNSVDDLPGTQNEAIILADQDMTIRQMNEAAVLMFHYRKEELIGKNVRILVPDNLQMQHEQAVAKLIKNYPDSYNDHPLVSEARTKDGRTIPVWVVISAWQDGGKLYFGAAIRRRYKHLSEDVIPEMLLRDDSKPA